MVLYNKTNLLLDVWFQNTRAKDKKSRNQQRQHFSNISDDNSNSSSVTNNNLKANISGLATLVPTAAGSEVSNDIIRDCNLCQVTQVNIQQHAFTVEHIRKVKELLAQTSAAAAAVSLLQEGGEDDDKCSLMDYRDQQAAPNGEQQHQNVQQQQQLALMMMAFQTQNMSNSMMAFNMLEDNSAECDGADELSENNFSTKPMTKNQKKTKRNPIKKKKLPMKTPIAENLANDNEIFFNFNAQAAGTTTHLNVATGSRRLMVDNYKNANSSVDSSEANDGNNNNRHDDIEMAADDEQVAEGNRRNINTIANNCESINDATDLTKSQIYNYNHIGK
ncbi:putative uncharacterized protein DDB_G0286901 [Calliphora vicina]|uniref:putative uncharacterized protein DDB_G0286901 n=1 Tax=Calliphora vicina TaxID=7373 RepID=UPI00325BC9EB